MSADDGPGTREVAHRVFAAEYDDATLSWAESDEERAPTYVITPSGAKVNRLFLVGVLTEVEDVNEEMLRGRVVDPTGAFVVYAGQYQPDARSFFERVNPPAFVAVTGKARTFQPDDADRVFTSVRPESVNEVDADTRDRWVVGTAEATLSRVGTMARVLDGEVVPAETTGPALARGHYDTSATYLSALRDLAVSAAAVVAGDRDEVEPLSTDPDAPGQADLGRLTALVDEADLRVATDLETAPAGDADPDAGTETATPETDAAATGESEVGTATDDEQSPAAVTTAEEGTAAETASTDADEAAGDPADEPIGDFDAGDDLGDFESGDETDGASTDTAEDLEDEETPATTNGDAEVAGQPDEMYELDEEERREVEEEYGTEFSSGAEVESPGDADLETPGPEADEPETEPDANEAPEADEEELEADEEEPDTDEEELEAETESDADEAPEAGEGEPEADEEELDADEEEPEADEDELEADEEEPEADEDELEADEEESETDEEEPAADVDEVLMETMRDLDEGGGADREELIDRVSDATGASADEVEDAIQDALMGGQCYEPDDDTLKLI